jgi:uncharacterized protein
MIKHHRFLHSIFLTLTFLFLYTLAVQALEIPAPSGYRVNDFAGALNPDTKERLESKLRTFEKETTTQIVLAIFPSLEDESLDDFVNRMFIAWKIGKKNNNNGVLLAIFTNERKVRIEVGYGLEGALTDAVSSRIIRKELVPEFKAGNYDAGVERTVDAITKVARSEYTAPASQQRNENLKLALAIIFLLIPLIIMLATRRKTPHKRRRASGSSGYDLGSSGGDWSSGGSSGGDFSGGGGSAGGGGASGSW